MKKIFRLIVMALFLISPLVVKAQIQPYFGGVGIASQAPKGLHITAAYIPVTANQINDANGDAISSIDMGMGAMSTDFDFKVHAAAIACTWVSDKKILGASYSASAILPYAASYKLSFTATAPDGSVIPIINETTPGLYDLVLTPIMLGWNKQQWDFSAGLSTNIPIGKYEAGAANRWCFMPVLGATYYFDQERSFSASAKATFEINGAQLMEGLDLAKGDEMIVEWGLGKMLIPFGRFGIIGYSVFQLNEDQGSDLTTTDLHSSHSIGGEYMMFLPPMKLGLLLRGVTSISAKDSPPISIFMVGLTKSF